MVRCKILVKGPYSDYQGSGTNRKAVVHSVGQVIQFPVNYAVLLADNDMVEILSERDVIEIDAMDQEPVIPPDATESAFEFAADNKIDLTKVSGSGTDGRITLTDVRRHQVESGA